MVALPLVHTFNWDAQLGKRLQSIRKNAKGGQFSDRRDLPAFLASKGIDCSESKLKRLETGKVPKVEKTFLQGLLESLDSGLDQILDQTSQPIQLKAPKK